MAHMRWVKDENFTVNYNSNYLHLQNVTVAVKAAVLRKKC